MKACFIRLGSCLAITLACLHFSSLACAAEDDQNDHQVAAADACATFGSTCLVNHEAKAKRSKKKKKRDVPQEIDAGTVDARKKEEPSKKKDEPKQEESKKEEPKKEEPKKEESKKEEPKKEEPKKDEPYAYETGSKKKNGKKEPAVDVASAEAPATDKPKPKTRTLEPLQVDAKLLGSIDVLLAYLGAGAAVDVGVARVGTSGTISVGVSGEYAFCASVCWAINGLTGAEFSQNQIAALARGGYHLDIHGRGVRKLDLFPFIMVGPTFANASMKYGTTEIKGSDVGIAIGGGFGISYFVSDNFFVGAEARFRWAQGTYEYEATTGNGTNNRRTIYDGTMSTWSQTGADFVLALGLRF